MNDLEQTAIERLKTASSFSLKLYKVPLLIAYSGGKDSDVLLRLAVKSGSAEARPKGICDGGKPASMCSIGGWRTAYCRDK